jgi:nitroreductase
MMTVEEAITGRRSIRAFLNDKPVPRALIERILQTAGRAPSGSNIQPWKVWVLTGAKKVQLSAEILALHAAGDEGHREYNYYPVKWREPCLARRRACGFGLYKTLGIGREDKARMHAQHARNFKFFDAPVGFIFTIERDMEIGSWLDTGMFLQSIMIAARALGLETCPQAAFANYPKVIQRVLDLPDDQMIICGMALGYADPNAVVNTFVTEREPLDTFTTWADA